MKIDDIKLGIRSSQDRDENWATLFHELIERSVKLGFDMGLVHPRNFLHDVVEGMEEVLLIFWSQEYNDDAQYRFNRENEAYRFGLVAGFHVAGLQDSTVHMIQISRNFTGDDAVLYHIGDPDKFWQKAFDALDPWLDTFKAEEIIGA
jgi:hypothetical protein